MVLVDGSGHATYVERTMEEGATDPDEAQWRMNTYEFDVTQETGDCSGHKSSENLENGNKNGESERTHKQPAKKHLKRQLINGTTSPVEPAKKAFVKE